MPVSYLTFLVPEVANVLFKLRDGLNSEAFCGDCAVVKVLNAPRASRELSFMVKIVYSTASQTKEQTKEKEILEIYLRSVLVPKIVDSLMISCGYIFCTAAAMSDMAAATELVADGR